MRRRSLFILVLLALFAPPAWAQQNVLDTDSFGGTNGTLLHAYNANWIILDATNINEVAIRGTPGIGANSNSGGDLRNGFTWTNDHWSELTIDGTTLPDTRLLVGARCTQGSGNNSTGYMGGVHRDITGGTYQIYKFSNPGTFTALVTGTHSYALNDVVNFQAVGTTLTLKVNGSTEATTTDATYATGSPCLLVGSQASRIAGSWRAGSVGGTSAPSLLLFGVGPGGQQ